MKIAKLELSKNKTPQETFQELQKNMHQYRSDILIVDSTKSIRAIYD